MAAFGLIDLSQKLKPNMQIYPGDPQFTCTSVTSIDKDGCNVHSISLGSHTGTHVDAPYHFFADGKKIDEIPLSAFIGQGLVINLATKGGRKIITWDDLAPYSSKMHEGVIVLLLTGWSAHWNTPRYNDHPFISREAAEGIMSCGVCVVGIDTLSVDETIVDGTANDASFAAHEVILGSGGIIAENLTNLEAIVGQDAVVSLVPLNIQGCDGSPVRAYARLQLVNRTIGGFLHIPIDGIGPPDQITHSLDPILPKPGSPI